jgi:hypothetical protein
MSEIHDGRNDFNFFVGSWKGLNRRLRERLAGSTDWEVFESRLVNHKILNGLGNFDEVSLYREASLLEGVTLRLYNPDTQEWAHYWASSAGANTLSPLTGKFDKDCGTFYAYELIQGQHIFVRFLWRVFNNDSSRWEQAFSTDAGQSWETNWICDFTREA